MTKLQAENMISGYDRVCEDVNRCRTARDMANRAEQVAQQEGKPVNGNVPAAHDAYNRARADRAAFRLLMVAALTGAT